MFLTAVCTYTVLHEFSLGAKLQVYACGTALEPIGSGIMGKIYVLIQYRGLGNIINQVSNPGCTFLFFTVSLAYNFTHCIACSIIFCLVVEIFMQKNSIVTKFCHLTTGVPLIMPQCNFNC